MATDSSATTPTQVLPAEWEYQFQLPVDSEYKTTVFRPWIFHGVHMKAFHASWLSFFVSMVSTFAPAALSIPIRDTLDLDDNALLTGDILAICATVVSRVAMGSFCDAFGPKIGHAALLLTTALGVFGFGYVHGATGTFVCSQYWSSVMFNVRIVGIANATGSGGGATGGGATQVLMPLLFSLLSKLCQPFVAWRVVLVAIGCAHVAVAILVLTMTQDLPTGSFAESHKKAKTGPSPGLRPFSRVVRNYRVWVLAFYYGIGVGIVFVLDNIITPYYYDSFEISYSMAGLYGSLFELVNVPTRLLGGYLSDLGGEAFGMRGRLYVLLAYQIATAAALILLAMVNASLVRTVVAMEILAFATQGNQAAVFAVVPFISNRSLGSVAGVVGSFSTLGAVVFQFIFFNQNRFETHQGFLWCGVVVLFSSFLLFAMHFPMWGGMLTKPKPGATEEDYYYADYTAQEIEMGMAEKTTAFASEAKSQRGGAKSSSRGSAV